MRSTHTLALCFGFAAWAHAQRPHPPLIPVPEKMEWTEGTFPLVNGLSIALYQPELKAEAAFLQEGLRAIGVEAKMEPVRRGLGLVVVIGLAQNKGLEAEGYELTVTPEGSAIYGADAAGLFHGIQTFLQLMPEPGTQNPAVPCVLIRDRPRFAWRGMHLDVCRHFMPANFIKKYIDLLARYKMNTFHWHLTDDQGWRIEIERYPKLTEVGAWRDGSMVGPYRNREYDSLRYGGFYTQEEIREVVAYAAARHITVVPEIEMPGHALAALAAYPELSCTGGPFEVEKGWGVFEDVFCPNDSTIAFLQNVLAEVIDLFPSEYIHIGGDECPKERWKTCPKCQARMKAEGLNDEHALQSYFIQRIERFVNGKGRKIIGWDEILEGGLAPNAAVMSWRGTEGGIAAAKEKHYVVMSPGTHCYFDHYQGDPAQEPLAIGGYTTLQKVYSFEPIPAELDSTEAKYILGAQGNVWTEYISTPEHVEYMVVPRMLALAEVLWSPKQKRDEKDFIQRLWEELPRLDSMHVNASRSLLQVTVTPKPGNVPGEVRVELTSSLGLGLSYSVLPPPFDVSLGQLNRYDAPVTITSDCEVEGWFMNEGTTGPVATRRFTFNKATARIITCEPLPNERYQEGGPFTLVDGIRAGERRVNYEWLGWRKDVTITIDLGSEQALSSIGIGALEERTSWIHLPEKVTISTSTDRGKYEVIGTVLPAPDAVGNTQFAIEQPIGARFVKFEVKNVARIPDGFAGAGSPAWLFLDEIDIH
ncbi:MAG: family 20 glycosylhydrolase [Flavobacteriales bacterium]